MRDRVRVVDVWMCEYGEKMVFCVEPLLVTLDKKTISKGIFELGFNGNWQNTHRYSCILFILYHTMTIPLQRMTRDGTETLTQIG